MSLHARETPSLVIFDLGGVLIDWDPRYLFRTLLRDRDEVEAFLEEISFAAWNAELDAGAPFGAAVDRLAARHPDRAALIRAFRDRWPETVGGEVPGTVEVLRELRAAGIRLFALSNWSAETFPAVLERFEFLRWFEGIVISGQVGAIKPAIRPYIYLLERHGIQPSAAVFIDDAPENVAAASRLGLLGIRFGDAASLRSSLVELGLL